MIASFESGLLNAYTLGYPHENADDAIRICFVTFFVARSGSPALGEWC